MSFILDALKKSEGERQRRSGPSFFEVKVAPPRARFPAWALAVGALLLVNIGVIAWLALRSSPATVAEGERTAPAPRSQTAAASIPLGSPAPAATAAIAPPADRVAPSSTLEPDEQTALEAPAFTELPEFDPELAEVPEERPAMSREPTASTRVRRGTGLGIPTYEQLAGAPGSALPELRLDLHVFANEPADRFVFLNNARLREGETLRDGTRVESIVPDGVVLSAQGTRFLLQRQ
jgi:general secretion pathway protein B